MVALLAYAGYDLVSRYYLIPYLVCIFNNL